MADTSEEQQQPAATTNEDAPANVTSEEPVVQETQQEAAQQEQPNVSLDDNGESTILEIEAAKIKNERILVCCTCYIYIFQDSN